MQRYALWVVLGWLMLAVMSAAEVRYVVGPDIPFELLYDANAELTLEEVAALPSSAFSLRQQPMAEGFRQGVHWQRFALSKADFASFSELWMKIDEPFLDDMQLYVQLHGEWSLQRLGDMQPAAQALIDYRQFIFVLPQPSSDVLQVIVRLETTSSHIMNATVMSPRVFFEATNRDIMVWSFYFGLASFSLLLAISMAVFIRTWAMFSLVAFAFTNFTLVASLYGFLSWTVLKPLPWLVSHVVSITMFANMATVLWLIRELLVKPLNRPWLDTVFRFMIAVNILSLLSVPVGLYGIVVPYNHLLTHSTIWLGLGAAMVWGWQRGWGYGLVLGCIMVYAIAILGGSVTVLGWFSDPGPFYRFWHYTLLMIMVAVLGVTALQLREDAKARAQRLALQQEVAAIREAQKLQRQFVGLVAHEFLNPLGVVILQAKMAQQSETQALEPVQKRFESIENAALRLKKLFHHWINTNRVLEDQMSLVKQTVKLDQWVHWVVHNGLLQNDREVIIKLDPVHCELDPELMTFAINNLIDNACKYSPISKPIEVVSTCRPQSIGISVLDHGPGVPFAQRERLFERHTRQHKDLYQVGMGMGLYLTSLVAEHHGGHLEYTDKAGYGSCFTIWFPR